MISLIKLYYRIGRDYFSGTRRNPNSKFWVDYRGGVLRAERTERIFTESCLQEVAPGDEILVRAIPTSPGLLSLVRKSDSKELGAYYARKD